MKSKKMFRKAAPPVLVLLLVSVALAAVAFTACKNSGSPEPVMVTVSFDLDGGTLNGKSTIASVTGIAGEPFPAPAGIKTSALKSPIPLEDVINGSRSNDTPKKLKRWTHTIPVKFPSRDVTCKAIWEDMKKTKVEFDLDGHTYTGGGASSGGSTVVLEGWAGSDFVDSSGDTIPPYEPSNFQLNGSSSGQTMRWVDSNNSSKVWNENWTSADHAAEIADFFNGYKFPEKNVKYTAKAAKTIKGVPYTYLEMTTGSLLELEKSAIQVANVGSNIEFSSSNSDVAKAGADSGNDIGAYNPGSAVITIKGGLNYHDAHIYVNVVKSDNSFVRRLGKGSDSRTFTLGDRTYHFKEVKTFHFYEETDPTSDPNNPLVFVPKSNQLLTFKRNGNTAPYTQYVTAWASSTEDNAQTGSEHLFALQLGQGVTIKIPKSDIGDYDYVEFSMNYWSGWPKVVLTTSSNSSDDGNKLTLKNYKSGNGNPTGLGWGSNWTGINSNAYPTGGVNYMPLLRSKNDQNTETNTSAKFINNNEYYIVCGAWNDPNSDNSLIFSQHNYLSNLNHQSVALIPNTNRDRMGTAETFEFDISQGSGDMPVFFDFIAFYKLQE